ncbi:Transmembrane protein [Melia azedarach]|uniref:Transmembrane protein n=1 Tax=Melia azedarach TaxID=155640 RepID=A0ACC1YFG1_MELAZ|nr:Transmembrane protein [Melia azedarach]
MLTSRLEYSTKTKASCELPSNRKYEVNLTAFDLPPSLPLYDPDRENKEIRKTRRLCFRNWVFVMGKVCCDSDDGGLDPIPLLIVVVLALAIMAVCHPPPRRTVYAVYRYC